MTATRDVVVVGAGPAGAHLALRLARAGFAVTLLDRSQFPRPKPCGEFMSPACLPMLEELGIAWHELMTCARAVRGMEIHGHGHIALGTYVPVGRATTRFAHGWAVRRDVLDAMTVRCAAAEPSLQWRPGTALVDLLHDRGGAVLGVRTRDEEGREDVIRARFTIGADGVRSKVASLLGVRREIPWLSKFAFVTRYRGVVPLDHAQVHLFDGGYFASTTVDDGLFSLNLVVDRAALPRDGDTAAFLERMLARVPALRERLARAERVDPIRATGPLAFRTTAQAFDGAALVGDACGYVDPVTGEGIFLAMRGAQRLAVVLGDALRAGRTDAGAIEPWVRTWRREIAPHANMALWLQRGLRHPWLVRAALTLLERRAGLCDLLVSVAGDYVPLRELLRPRVWLGAWRRQRAI